MNETDCKTSLKNFEEKVCEYEEMLEGLYKSGIEEYQSAVMQLGDQVKAKFSGIVGLQESICQYENRDQESRDRLIALKNDIDQLGNSKENLEKQQSLLQAKLIKLNDMLSQEICEKNDIKSLYEETQERIVNEKNMHNNITLFKKYLGLEFRTLKDDRIQFIFHNALENKPEFVMFVIIQLTNKVYSVLDSEPELNNLKELEKALNETNNLAGFVQHVYMLLKAEAEKMPE